MDRIWIWSLIININKMKIPISEIFQSIQWEWRNTWKPSIFIRFWWCNLKCTWCDSKYSWDPSIEKADIMELSEVLDIIRNFESKHIIFTGGEPSLFQKQMLVIQEELRWEEYSYELETNGSKVLDMNLDFEQVNISPKLKSSWNNEYELEILKSDLFNYNYVDLKFVCSNIKDTTETDEYIKKITNYYGFNKIDDIYIMPLWRDDKSQVNNYLVKYCINNAYKYCLRQHLILFWDGKWK